MQIEPVREGGTDRKLKDVSCRGRSYWSKPAIFMAEQSRLFVIPRQRKTNLVTMRGSHRETR